MNKMIIEIQDILDKTLIIDSQDQWHPEYKEITRKSKLLASSRIDSLFALHIQNMRKKAKKEKWKWLRTILYSFIQKTREMEKND